MRKTFFKMTLPLVAVLCATLGYAQDEKKPDSTNIYIGEAIDRSQIDSEELPQEVKDSLDASQYGDMKMVAVYKVDIVPGKETATESSLRKEEPASSARPYRVRNDDIGFNETYYQDTYDDIPENSEGVAQDETEMEDSVDPSSEAQATAKQQKPEKVDTYYEVEVNTNTDAYVLLFDEAGHLTHKSSLKSRGR